MSLSCELIHNIKIKINGGTRMTNVKANGSLGSYVLSFTANDIAPNDFIENFTGGNIKEAKVTDNHIHFINNQGRELIVDLVDFGLNELEHLDDEMNESEQFKPNGW